MRETYSVDEASLTLGIPRPTVYRYLKEYSIPHVKRSGRISIPGDSVERIRRVRDLHGEGMGTGAVRRLIREDERSAPEAEISSRLDRISEELVGARTETRQTGSDDVHASQALRTLLARQTLLVSAVLDLTDMVEELMRANGHQLRRRTGTGGPALSDVSSGRGASGAASAVSPAPVAYLTPRDGIPAMVRRREQPVRSRAAVVRVAKARSQRTVQRDGRVTSRPYSGYGTLARRRRSAAVNALLILSVAVLGFVVLRSVGIL